MSEFKGTKGKWEYDGGDNSSIDIILDNNSTISISRYDRYGTGLVGTRLEMQANALLISKAPEMLEMLKKQTQIIDGYLQEQANNGSYPSFIIDTNEDTKKLIKEATEI
jgi:hypothetical protein